MKGVKVFLYIVALKHFAFEHGKREKKNGFFERRKVIK